MAANKTVRWINLVKVLRDAIGGLTTAEVKERLDNVPGVVPVDLRTVQRDLIELDDSGLVGLERQPRDGREVWRMDRTFVGFTGDRILSGSAALTLKMAIQHASVLLPVDARNHLLAQAGRVENVLRFEGIGGRIPWSDKVRVLPSGYQLAEPELNPKVVGAVYESLARETKLKMNYQRLAITAEQINVYSPLALVYRAPHMYLIASGKSREQPFVIPLHRIRNATAMDSAIERPTDFDLDKYIADGHLDSRQGEPIRLRLKCTRALADHWRTATLGAEQNITGPKNEPIIEATCPNTEALKAYLLGLGTQIEVLGPYELRSWMVFKVHELADRYAELFADDGASRTPV